MGGTSAPLPDFYPDLVLRMIDLKCEIDPAGAGVELQSGILKFELPKVAKAAATGCGTSEEQLGALTTRERHPASATAGWQYADFNTSQLP